MATYYYLISSLPMLKADGSIPITFSSFLEQCKSCVSPATYKSLCDLSNGESSNPLLQDWASFHNTLTEELSYQRNLKLGKPAVQPDNRNSEVINTVAAALSAKNPLVSEQMLMELEFNRVDSAIGLHNFDDYFLFGYALKLKILERLQLFDHDKGETEFKTLFTGVKNQILSI